MKRTVSAGKLLILITALLSASCGYRMSGTGSLVPPGTKTIAIPAFINNTNEPSIDVDITRAVVDEFISDGRLRVVDLQAAELVLRGTVIRFLLQPLSYSATPFVTQYQVKVMVKASLEDTRTRRILWSENGIESIFLTDHPVSIGDIRLTKIAKEAAVQRACQDIAWTLRSRVLEGF